MKASGMAKLLGDCRRLSHKFTSAPRPKADCTCAAKVGDLASTGSRASLRKAAATRSPDVEEDDKWLSGYRSGARWCSPALSLSLLRPSRPLPDRKSTRLNSS